MGTTTRVDGSEPVTRLFEDGNTTLSLRLPVAALITISLRFCGRCFRQRLEGAERLALKILPRGTPRAMGPSCPAAFPRSSRPACDLLQWHAQCSLENINTRFVSFGIETTKPFDPTLSAPRPNSAGITQVTPHAPLHLVGRPRRKHQQHDQASKVNQGRSTTTSNTQVTSPLHHDSQTRQ